MGKGKELNGQKKKKPNANVDKERKSRDSCLWYLDSGCSRHMTENKVLFKTLFEGKIGTVTFGDGSKSVIRGVGTWTFQGYRYLKMSSM